MLKIALLGYGKMGRLIERLIVDQSRHEIIAKVSSRSPLDLVSINLIAQADVVIDFSHASCTLRNIEMCCHLKKNLVIGTTGWEKELPEAESMIQNSCIGCLHASNFSLGIHFFKKLLEYAARQSLSFPDYEIAGVELHHSLKADAPSGTAKTFSQSVSAILPKDKPLSFTSIRCGSIPGTHSIYFDSDCDTIILTHEARNREGFARGAIKSAEWIINKIGLFTLDDITKEHLCL